MPLPTRMSANRTDDDDNHDPLLNKIADAESIQGPTIWGMEYGTAAWLFVFCATGVWIGMSYEFLQLHSIDGKLADPKTFLMCFLAYVGQVVMGGGYALTRPNALRGTWTKDVWGMVLLAAFFDGCGQALDFEGQLQGGYVLFTMFHSSVTLWCCVIAKYVLKRTVTPIQWGGVLVIIAGLFATFLPQPITVPKTGSYVWGVGCSLIGSLFLAASYPFSELVFRVGKNPVTGKVDPISEEMSCFVGASVNTLVFGIWTLAYTCQDWHTYVTALVKPGEQVYITWGYIMYASVVGLHSLSFWKSVNLIGTIPTAVSKGAQQGGVFIFSHIIYCKYDKRECMTWNYPKEIWTTHFYNVTVPAHTGSYGSYGSHVETRSYDTEKDDISTWSQMQKSVAIVACVAGVAIYALNGPKTTAHDDDDDDDDLDDYAENGGAYARSE